MINAAYAQWLELSVAWLYKIFGANTFTDKSTSKMAQHLAKLGITMPGAPGHG